MLLLVPWSRFWERNYFADLAPAVQMLITNHYVRGAVSGLGLVNIWMAVSDLATVLGRRSLDPDSVSGHEA